MNSRPFSQLFKTVAKTLAMPLLASCLFVLPITDAVAQARPAVKKSEPAKKATPKKEVKKDTKKAEPKKTDTKKTTKKAEPAKKTTKKTATQPSTDGKGVIPVSPHNADGKTLLEGQEPTKEELSLANQELLAKNTELERNINALTIQNNVLARERSGQLFLYGTMTALFSVILGGLVVKLFGQRKERW